MIDAVNSAAEVNSALGFNDPNLGLGDKTLVVGAWALAGGSAYFTQSGWLRVVRRVTPDHLRPGNKRIYKKYAGSRWGLI